VLDVPIRIRSRHNFDQLAAYGGAFDTQRNFRTFFEWFRAREDLENERRVDRKSYRDPQLEAVRAAVEAFMEGCTELRVRRNPLRMTLMKDRQELQVNQLSDGEKVVLSLVGDLARRLAIANPGLERPLEGQGCALVDEIDLHLHPSWQRQIVQKLPQVFPNLQFFLTTHSPIIAGATPADSLFVLEDGRVMNASVYGQDAGLILAEVFDTSPRPESVRSDLDALFLAIAEKRDDAAGLLAGLEHKLSPSDPELVKARVLMRGARRP
jgi:predicted ATP-binding protein involved in virulence